MISSGLSTAMSADIIFDADLIRRYDRRGPRYTSYPTAAQFHTAFDISHYRRAALLSNADPSLPLSAYVHIPFCASPCFYCGCNKIVTRDPGQAEQYLDRLEKEIALQSRLFDPRRRIRQLHFGGGTPTFLSTTQLERLMEHLNRHFRFDEASAREFSIEIDPRTVNAQSLRSLKLLGFNRLSLGVQDFDPQVQAAVNRVQSVELTREVVEEARRCGFDSLSFDLIYGLPLQTPGGFAETLNEVLRLRPNRIAAYAYAHLPKLFKAQHAIREDDLPSPAARLQLLQLTVATLTAAGYVYIGLDHFALPDDALVQAQRSGQLHRNFQGYSTHAECDLVGLGMSSIGKLGRTYAQNAKQLADYYLAIDSGSLAVERGVVSTVDDITRSDVIQRLMCQGRVAIRDIEARYALEFRRYFAPELKELETMARDGLLTLNEETIEVAPPGRLLLRNIAMVFDIYSKSSAEERFSKTM